MDAPCGSHCRSLTESLATRAGSTAPSVCRRCRYLCVASGDFKHPCQRSQEMCVLCCSVILLVLSKLRQSSDKKQFLLAPKGAFFWCWTFCSTYDSCGFSWRLWARLSRYARDLEQGRPSTLPRLLLPTSTLVPVANPRLVHALVWITGATRPTFPGAGAASPILCTCRLNTSSSSSSLFHLHTFRLPSRCSVFPRRGVLCLAGGSARLVALAEGGCAMV